MDSLSRSSDTSGVANLLIDLVAREGTASHPYCGPAVEGDRQSFVGDLVDFADFVHFVALLHGQVPGLIDHAASRTADVAARGWLVQALDAFTVEREYLGRLCVAVGPLPSTAGHHQTSSIISQQRHAVEMLAQSDRHGCALGTAITMVLEWDAIRTILDAGALRLGIEPPARRMPARAESVALIGTLPDPEKISRAMVFGASQLLGQHKGMWDMLEARAKVRQHY